MILVQVAQHNANGVLLWTWLMSGYHKKVELLDQLNVY
jgi:hypothetical protein